MKWLNLSRFIFLIVTCCLMLPIHAANEVVVDSGSKGNPAKMIEPFGASLFKGNFLQARGNGLNPEYALSPGDRVSVSAWGAVNISETFSLDSQGNIFIPQIGPLRLEGVKNKNLTTAVKEHIKTVYIDNFDVYTNLITAQPVAVYVTGMVNKPGRYSGIPSDSVLYFVDLAGGIDADLGSYRNIEIIRKDKVITTIDLYDFILKGEIAVPQLQEDDTILIKQRGAVVQLEGNVAKKALVEMKAETALGGAVLKIIPKAAQATEVTIVGIRQGVPIKQTMPIITFLDYALHAGDTITLRDDGRSNNILINIVGEFDGPSLLSVKRGSRLVDVLNHIPVNLELANTKAIHLRRSSVVAAQKDAINDSLFRLERSSLLALSGSAGEANIRAKEADLMAKFAERARLIDPLGRVVTVQGNVQQNILLEANDSIVIPTNTQIVRIAGEVMTMHAVTYREQWTVAEYIEKTGGFSERANQDKIIIHHPNAEVEVTDSDAIIQPGDEIIVLPKIDPKYRQFGIDLLDIIYKIAVSAKIAIDL